MTLLASCGTAQAVSITFSALLNGTALCPWSIREDELGGLAAGLVAEEIRIYASAASVFRHLVGSLTGAERFPRLRLIRLENEQVRRSDVEMSPRHFRPRAPPPGERVAISSRPLSARRGGPRGSARLRGQPCNRCRRR